MVGDDRIREALKQAIEIDALSIVEAVTGYPQGRLIKIAVSTGDLELADRIVLGTHLETWPGP